MKRTISRLMTSGLVVMMMALLAISSASAHPSIHSTPTRAHVITNLSQGKTATASSVYDLSGTYVASKAVDGDTTTTRWVSQNLGNDEWLQVNLAGTYTVSEVKLFWEAAYATDYTLQVSPNGTTWTTIYTDNAGTGGTDDITGLDSTTQYVRVSMTGNAPSKFAFSLWEFQVFGQAPVNMAQGKTATASSEYSATYNAAQAVDGDTTTTRWSSVENVSLTTPEWWQVDLGSTTAINEVKLFWYSNSLGYASSYQIQVSNDASTWTSIYTTTTGAGGNEDLTGLTGSGRYLRVNMTARVNPSTSYSLWEVQVFGNLANLASGKTAAASSVYDLSGTYVASKAVDNNFTTRWVSQNLGNDEWLRVDFGVGNSYTINEVKIYWEKAYATAYTVQTSPDASTWTTIKTVTAGTGGIEDLTSLTGSGRYLRVNLTGNATGLSAFSIWEFQAFGHP